MSATGTAQDRAEQIRPLDHRGADQQPAVASPFDRDLRGAGVSLADKELGGRDEVVEHVLLLVEHPGAMPFLAVLAAAAQVREREDAAAVEEWKVAGVVGRRAV